MNSFRFLERGVDAEIQRQETILRDGGTVTQETLHYDPQTGAITSTRSKEEAHDYRYLPEPDLVPVAPTEAMLERARAAIPELPVGARRAARARARAAGRPRDACWPSGPSSGTGSRPRWPRARDADPTAIANWVVGDFNATLEDGQDPADSNVEPTALAALVAMVGAGEVSRDAAKEVLGVLASDGGDPRAIVEAKGLGRPAADELGGIVDQAIAAQPDAAQKIRDGNMKAIGAIMGVVMRETQGRADGAEVQKLIREKLT